MPLLKEKYDLDQLHQDVDGSRPKTDFWPPEPEFQKRYNGKNVMVIQSQITLVETVPLMHSFRT